MDIKKLIDRNCPFLGILEDSKGVYEALKKHPYLAVINEESVTTGILTLKDFHNHPHGRIIDYQFNKPKITSDQHIFEVFNIMKASNEDYLPVFEPHFIGVISLKAIAENMFESVVDIRDNIKYIIHDLKNPINNMQGLVNLLDQHVAEESKDLISLLSVSCKLANDRIDDLLWDDKRTINRVPTELNDFYLQCISEQKGLALMKDITMIVRLSAEPVIKNIDQSLVKRAVQNVIHNAIKFSSPTSAINITSHAEDDHLTLKVINGGMDIPDHLQPLIFTRSTDVQRPGTSGESSNGLGLYIAKRFIEYNNGTITFESSNQVTRFYIRF